MRARWVSYDTNTLNTEFRTIPQPDRGSLFEAMGKWAKGESSGWILRNYGDGLLMLKSKSRGSGRCLFFTLDRNGEVPLSVALLAYKKESNDAPKALIEKARMRRKKYLDNR